ncbi:DUF1576 domain-containing protein [Halonatronum saccharophilum]|uniref:DUF1576 domain-containing protein n=1 Tax=Halonatronum saccharophilum TaxID=150060 RepID=UPI0004B1A9C7|nr:DUF1576 domain-containing protein [Halonatronum saccharophilum]
MSIENSLKLKGNTVAQDVYDITKPKTLEANENTKYLILLAYASFILVSSFFFNSPQEIWLGIRNITVAPSILVSDYMVIGNLGAALFNAGLLMIISITIAKINKVNMNGTVIAAILTVAGFALFGKNVYNIWSILLGVYIYSLVQKENYSKFILVALFGTALGPMVSQVSFGLELNLISGVILGNTVGVIAGFILPPLANHLIKFHQGFNIYNIGFTAGMTGTLFMAVFRSFGFENPTTLIVAEGYNYALGIYLSLLFISMLLIGYLYNGQNFKGYKKILSHSGRLVDDFVISEGFGITFINMGLLGLVTTLYVIIIGGQLNGAIIGGIFTVVGFGAFGKHLSNVIPILLGVYLSTFLQIWDVNTTGPLLAALFGTTLAPIPGQFGWKYGVLAGFIHMAMVMNVGYLHGGMNLYNNGFSGGMVAALLVPIITAFKEDL